MRGQVNPTSDATQLAQHSWHHTVGAEQFTQQLYVVFNMVVVAFVLRDRKYLLVVRISLVALAFEWIRR